MKNGTNTSVNKWPVILDDGIRIFVEGNSYFLSYKDYPGFRNQNIFDIQNVKMDMFGNLHWPALDIDIELESIKHPERYPLKYQI